MAVNSIQKEVKAWTAWVLIPPFRTLVRYGVSDSSRHFLWNSVCSRLVWRSHPFVSRTRYGFRFAGNSRDLVARYVYYFGVWEPGISEWICSLPLAGRTVIDVGASLGWYSLLGAERVGPAGRVVSIEASPICFAGLKRNVSLNGFGRIRPINVAAWNEEAELDLFPGPDVNSGVTTVVASYKEFESHPGAEYKPGIKVKASPLFRLLQPDEVAGAGLVKIDVEGAEPEVIEGLLPLLPRFPQDVQFLLEVTPVTLRRCNRTLDDFLSAFTRQGFRPYTIENEYSPEFYLDALARKVPRPTELRGEIAQQTDLILSRQSFSG